MYVSHCLNWCAGCTDQHTRADSVLVDVSLDLNVTQQDCRTHRQSNSKPREGRAWTLPLTLPARTDTHADVHKLALWIISKLRTPKRSATRPEHITTDVGHDSWSDWGPPETCRCTSAHASVGQHEIGRDRCHRGNWIGHGGFPHTRLSPRPLFLPVIFSLPLDFLRRPLSSFIRGKELVPLNESSLEGEGDVFQWAAGGVYVPSLLSTRWYVANQDITLFSVTLPSIRLQSRRRRVMCCVGNVNAGSRTPSPSFPDESRSKLERIDYTTW